VWPHLLCEFYPCHAAANRTAGTASNINRLRALIAFVKVSSVAQTKRNQSLYS
jgi:hypothetical protein